MAPNLTRCASMKSDFGPENQRFIAQIRGQRCNSKYAPSEATHPAHLRGQLMDSLLKKILLLRAESESSRFRSSS